MGLDDYFSLKAAMQELGISRSLIYSMKTSGKIKFRKLGRRVFIKKSEIEKLLA